MINEICWFGVEKKRKKIKFNDLIVQQLPSYLKDDKKFGVEKKRKKIKFSDCLEREGIQ